MKKETIERKDRKLRNVSDNVPEYAPEGLGFMGYSKPTDTSYRNQKRKNKPKPKTSYGEIHANSPLGIILLSSIFLFCLILMISRLPKMQAQDVLFTTRIEIVQGNDGLFYSQCLQGCDEFYNIAPIDLLYRGQPTDWQAMNHYKQLESAFLGLIYVPLPTPEVP